MEIISRKQALVLGLKRYFTGKSCKHGHTSERYVNGRGCCGCLDAWKKSHVNEYIEYRIRTRKHKHEYDKNRWSVTGTEVSKKRRQEYEKNPEPKKKLTREYKQVHPERVSALSMKRKASRLQRTPPWLTAAHYLEIEAFYQLKKLMEEITGVKHHVDHIVPLQGKLVSGLHVPWNLQVVTAEENMKKGNRYDV